MRQPFSVAIITLNAATQLEACLQSVRFADDIVVVNSGSTDGTQALAERYGARVIDQTWLGFGPQKQFAVDAARHDWVLCLDADERVTPQLQTAIEHALTQPTNSAYRFARCNRFLGRYLKHGEGYPDWSLRLFDRRQARWSDDAVHEKVVANGIVGTLQGDLLHDSAETLAAYLARTESLHHAGRRDGAAGRQTCIVWTYRLQPHHTFRQVLPDPPGLPRWAAPG